MSTNVLIGLGATAVVIAVAGAARSVVRERTIDQGKEARATILHVEHVVPNPNLQQNSFRQPHLLIQVAIPRGDGTEIVAVAKAAHWSIDKTPEPGWTVPVYYRERLGSPTLVEIAGPPSRPAKADPPA